MLEKIKKLNIEVIAPSHGYILRENTAKFIQMYDEMSSLAALKQPKKVTIVYSTMTGNTAKIAQKLVQGLESAGVETSVFNLKILIWLKSGKKLRKVTAFWWEAPQGMPIWLEMLRNSLNC